MKKTEEQKEPILSTDDGQAHEGATAECNADKEAPLPDKRQPKPSEDNIPQTAEGMETNPHNAEKLNNDNIVQAPDIIDDKRPENSVAV